MCFDLTSKESFAVVEKNIQAFRNECSQEVYNNIVIVGNKVDCEEHKREVETWQGERLCNQLGCLAYYETSARENINVDETFFTIARGAYEVDKA